MRRSYGYGKKRKKSSGRFLKNLLIICAFAAAFYLFSQIFSLGSVFSGVNGFALTGGDTLYKYAESAASDNPGGPAGSASENGAANGSVSYDGSGGAAGQSRDVSASGSAAGQSRDVSGSGSAAQDNQALVDGSATGNNAGGGSASGNNADSGSASGNVSPNGSVSYNGSGSAAGQSRDVSASGSAAQDSQARAGGSATGNNAGGGSASGNVFPNGSVSYNGSVSAAGQSRDVSGSGSAAQDNQALVDGSATGNNAGGGSASGNVFPNGSVSYNGSVSAAGQSRDVSGSGIAAQDSQALVDGSATGNNAGGGSTSGNNADSGSASDNVSPNGSVSYNGSGSAAQDSQALAGGSATGNNAGGGSASGNAAANGSVSYNGSGNAAQDSQARANGSASVNTANGSASDNGAAPSAAAQTGSKPPSGPAPQPAPFKIDRIEDNQSLLAVGGVLGIDDVILQPETDMSDFSVGKEAVTIADMSKLRDLNYLRTSFYTVAKETALTAEDFDADSFVQTGLKIDNSVPGPKILIFHTHSSEMYADSDPNDPTDGVVAVGEKLADVLRTKYGIECLHDTGQYDMVDGVHTVMGAYERMEPEIEKILAANPSIQAAVDLHRDGLTDESIKLVTTVNGVPTAQIMFFNGLCKLNKNGVLTPIEGLPNPYIQTNLAFSFMAQLEANALYPDFTRKIYLNAYRYSLNMLPKSMLIEVGAQTNTKQEALNAMYPLADVLAAVLK